MAATHVSVSDTAICSLQSKLTPTGMGAGQVDIPLPVRRRLHDESVMLEEYIYYAKIQREQEASGIDPIEREKLFYGRNHSNEDTTDNKIVGEKTAGDEKTIDVSSSSAATPTEWEAASRAARNASWGSV